MWGTTDRSKGKRKGAAIYRGSLVGLDERRGSRECGEALDASAIRVRRARGACSQWIKATRTGGWEGRVLEEESGCAWGEAAAIKPLRWFGERIIEGLPDFKERIEGALWRTRFPQRASGFGLTRIRNVRDLLGGEMESRPMYVHTREGNISSAWPGLTQIW